MELAKPVMGTRVPAPACFAILSYNPKVVSKADKKIKLIETAVRAWGKSNPKF